MLKKNFIRYCLILFILSLNIACDQASKSIVRRRLNDYDQVGFLHNHFILMKVENSGAFLSMGNGLSKTPKIILLNAIPLLAILFGLVFILTRPNIKTVTLLALIMVIGGGIGNLYDRVLHGSVTDFMYINFGILHTGIFNVADLSITIGVIIILLHSLLEKKNEISADGL